MKKDKNREQTKKLNNKKLLAKFGFEDDEEDQTTKAIENWQNNIIG